MREHERIKIGVIIPNIRGGIYDGYLLQITYYVSVHLVDQGYLKDGDEDRIFESRGAAIDWAVEQELCGHVVYSALDDDRCAIYATIKESAFLDIRPAKVLLTA